MIMPKLSKECIYKMFVNEFPMAMQLDQSFNTTHREYMKELLRNESNVIKSLIRLNGT